MASQLVAGCEGAIFDEESMTLVLTNKGGNISGWAMAWSAVARVILAWSVMALTIVVK